MSPLQGVFSQVLGVEFGAQEEGEVLLHPACPRGAGMPELKPDPGTTLIGHHGQQLLFSHPEFFGFVHGNVSISPVACK